MKSLYEQAGCRRQVTQPTCLQALIIIYYVKTVTKSEGNFPY